MADIKVVTAAACLRSARLFNILAVASTALAATLFTIGQNVADKKMAFLPLALSLPPVMIWLAASIFVYAMVAHHPDLKVRHYNKWAGYRYYAVVGTLTILANDIAHLPTGWGGVWALFILALVPWSLYDIWKAGREDWQDIEISSSEPTGVAETDVTAAQTRENATSETFVMRYREVEVHIEQRGRSNE